MPVTVGVGAQRKSGALIVSGVMVGGGRDPSVTVTVQSPRAWIMSHGIGGAHGGAIHTVCVGQLAGLAGP
jgi:hypothetical protein